MNLDSHIKTLVWIYDLDEHYIRYANDAALRWWHAESLNELNKRNFASTTSDAVKQRLQEYKTKFENEETLQALWQFSPLGESKQAFCQFSGVPVDDAQGNPKLAMLIEATPAEFISPHINSDATVTLSSFSRDGSLISCNPPFSECFGNDVKSIHQIIAPSHCAEDEFFIPLSEHQHIDKELRFITTKGESWFQLEARSVKQSTGETTILCNFHNIQALKEKQLALFEQTQTDPLTGLLNRTGIYSAINAYIASNISFYIYYVDLDGFKMINDSLGHGTGDTLLKQIGQRLLNLEHPHVKACRFGGDEFVVCTAYVDNAINAEEIAAKIVKQLSLPYKSDTSDALLVSASVGFAAFPSDSQSLHELIRFADSAMYASKKLGKRRWTMFQSGMEKSLVRNSMITQSLPRAIAENTLSLHYQPIVDVELKKVHSFEALIRWEDSELGMVSPIDIINVAEQAGLILELENWVIAKTLCELKSLREQSNSEALIAINISATHIVRPEFQNYLMQQITQNNLRPSDVVIEITESVLLEDIAQNTSKLKALTQSGIRLSIDDFGTGYSSLAYLHNIDADTVKIDKAFLSKYSSSEVTLAAIKGLIESLGITPLIEGVETYEQAQLCKTIGIHLHQGYFYQKPQDLKQINLLNFTQLR